MPAGTNIVVPIMCMIYIFLAIWIALECAPAIVANFRRKSETLGAKA
jgi:Na+/alanine symporter